MLPILLHLKLATKYFSRWLDVSWMEYEISQILHHDDFMTALKAATITNLHISFTPQLLCETAGAFNCFIPLDGFNNLTLLELYEFWGPYENLAKDIACLLTRCPALKTLGLGLACEGDCDINPYTIFIEGDFDFLEILCLEYESLGAAPLRLETLRLGFGMCVYESKNASVGNYLEALFKIECLQVLHIFNGWVRLGPDVEDELMQVDWYLLDNCVSLRQVAIFAFGDEVKDWLNATARNMTELIITGNVLHLVLGLSVLFGKEDVLVQCHSFASRSIHTD